VIGGAAGAFPPLIGWVAATGSISTLPLLMFAIIFLWTPPHSWALALLIRDDYAKGGVPMLPVVASAATTRWQMLFYAVLMAAAAVSPWALGLAGIAYGAVAAIGLVICLVVLPETRQGTNGAPRRRGKTAPDASAIAAE
uniref:UbiA family prenyltransferase n=1 Tax=Pseudomonas sp. EA_15y_Pfl1_P102 TaxID=3088685 RepID=UPI0030DBECB0